MIGDEEFGTSSGYEDLVEENSARNRIEHMSNIPGVVQKISDIVHTECDRSKLISKICVYLLQTRGYPLGIKGDNILLEAKIIGVTDVVEAMCSHRPYRQAFGVEAALKEINSNSGRLCDKEVVAACTELFQKDKFIFPPDKFSDDPLT